MIVARFQVGEGLVAKLFYIFYEPKLNAYIRFLDIFYMCYGTQVTAKACWCCYHIERRYRSKHSLIWSRFILSILLSKDCWIVPTTDLD